SLRDLLRRFPDVALRVIDELGDQLRLARESSALIASGSVQARVAGALDRLCDKFGTVLPGELGTVELALPLSRADLAGLTGATVESVSRAMSSMQRAGIVSSGRCWTTVRDRERLRTLTCSRGPGRAPCRSRPPPPARGSQFPPTTMQPIPKMTRPPNIASVSSALSSSRGAASSSCSSGSAECDPVVAFSVGDEDVLFM